MKLQIDTGNKIVNWGQEPWANQNDYVDSQIIEVSNDIIPIGGLSYNNTNIYSNGEIIVIENEGIKVSSINEQISHMRDIIDFLVDLIENNKR